jgi:hypothetical protein
MFGILATLLCGGIATHAWVKNGRLSQEDKKRSKANGESWYYDYDKKVKRSVVTDEIVMVDYYSDKVIGLKTGRVYEDIKAKREAKWLEDMNKSAAKRGCLCHYRFCPEYRQHNGEMSNICRVDNETGRRFSIDDKWYQKRRMNRTQLDELFEIQLLNWDLIPTGETKMVEYRYWWDYATEFQGKR